MRILIDEVVSSGGLPDAPASLRREGRAMLDAIAADFGCVPGVEVCSARGGTPEALQEAASQADAALLIAPELDDLLAVRTQAALDAGCRLLGSPPAAIRLTADKLALARSFEQAGIATPATWPLLDLPGDAGFPCVVKPRHGAGSLATFVSDGPAALQGSVDAARCALPGGEFIVQPYHAGIAASVAVWIGTCGAAVSPGAYQRLSGDGRLRYLGGRTPLSRELRARAARLARRALACVPGLFGYVGVDLVLGATPAADVVIEVNPRLTTSYIGLRRLAKSNLAELWLRLACGQPVDEPVWRDMSVEFTAAADASLAEPV